jgi:hypothetical protein
MTDEAEKPTALPVPRWLTRAEKAAFRSIEQLRASAGKPLSPAELDGLCDYISARSRLADLRKIYRRELSTLRQDPDCWGDPKTVLALVRQLDAAAASARRLGRQLGLGPQTQSTTKKEHDA